MSILKPKDMQKAQEPNARVGSNQSERVSTNEGSQLGTPQTANTTNSSMPRDKQSQ